MSSVFPGLTFDDAMVHQVIMLKWMHVVFYLIKENRLTQVYNKQPGLAPDFLDMTQLSETSKLVQIGITGLLSEQSIKQAIGRGDEATVVLTKGHAAIKQRVENIEAVLIKLRDSYHMEQKRDLL